MEPQATGMKRGAPACLAAQHRARAVPVILALVTFTSAGIAAGQTPSAGSGPLSALDRFIGRWQGTSEGRPGKGTVEREYSRVLNARFVYLRNRVVYPSQEQNPKGEVHEDIGVFSADRARRRIVFRQFHVEGFVNQYVEEPGESDKALVFVTEAIENIPAGWRARETYTFLAPDELEEVFELAEPGKPFEVYSRARLTRVK
jgi:hypothetical protein